MTEFSRSEVLAVDMDGSLIRSDMTHELLVLCLRWAPHLIVYAVIQLIMDRAAAKRWLTARFGQHIDPAYLPYEEAVLNAIEAHRQAGGRAWLVSGSDHELVGTVANHLGIFERYEGSRPGHNLTSSRKAAFLAEAVPSGFSYIGNSRQDLAVWKVATSGFGVRAPAAAYRPAGKVQPLVRRTGLLRPIRKALRLHQWAKNILVFVVPGLMLGQLTGIQLLSLVGAFICFGLMASGTYILNDLFDIPDDRRHPTKRLRQLADGRLGVPVAIGTLVTLVAVSLAGAFWLDMAFGIVLCVYAIVTVAYSFRLKRLPIVDVFVLAGLFSLRVWGGAEIVNAPPSAWLMMFIGLVFLSLALAKRYVEIRKVASGGKIAGRGYRADDGAIVIAFGSAAANAAVLALAIYGLLAPNRLIDNPVTMMVVAAVLAAWFMRIWLIAGRGELNDDPVLFAVKDKVSLACLVVVAGFIGAESTRPVWSQWF